MTAQDTQAPLILFVDDEAPAVKYFQKAIEPVAQVATANSVEEGRRMLDQHAQSLMVLVSDQRMPGESGNELLHYARLNYPHMVRILTTAYSELEHTIEAVNQGQIHRYIQKPWEISALRMEMKQALDLARLQKEHAQLLREKMTVRQQQTVANRIGMLEVLCGSLADPDDFQPLETYLAAASMAGTRPYEADWVAMDYADLAEAEAQRGARFGHELGIRLTELRQRYKDWQPVDGLAPLAELLGGAQAPDSGILVIPEAEFLTEFLNALPDAPISAHHVSWLALLIWLHGKGCALQVSKQDNGLRCLMKTAPPPVPAGRLAYWMECFTEGEKG